MEKTNTYHKPLNLLTTENHKTIKGEKLGFKTQIFLYCNILQRKILTFPT